MIVRRLGSLHLGNKCIVIIDYTRWILGMLDTVRSMIDDVPYEIGWPAEKRLLAQSMSSSAYTKVAQDAYVIHGPVSFNKVIMHVGNEVIVDVY